MNQRNEGDRYIAEGNGRELHRKKQQGLIFWKNVGQIRVTGKKKKKLLLLLHAGTLTTATSETMKDLNESNKKSSVGKIDKRGTAYS